MRLPSTSWIREASRATVAIVLLGVIAGAAAALFLWLLALATSTRDADVRIVWLLPAAGLGIGWLYERYGQSVAGGVNLVLDRLHEGGPVIPARMAPIVVIGTLLTHLFGGSAGREGTAVQMASSIADGIQARLRVAPAWRTTILRAGVGAGFAGAFGTPWAASLFALEFSDRRLVPTPKGLPLILVAAHVANATSSWLFHGHPAYPTVAPHAWSSLLMAKWAVFALLVALSIRLFLLLKHTLQEAFIEVLPKALMWRMSAAGVIVVALWALTAGDIYLGLGIPTILASFEASDIPWYAFALKLVFTAVTLAGGFLGGEVTPFFFMGATLGHTLAPMLELPVALCAAVGLASMFGAAAGTPLALSLMAVELCGWSVLPHVLLVSILARAFRGRESIYSAQRPRLGVVD